MQNLFELYRKKYAWALTLGALLVCSTTYTLLDAFVLPKTYAPPEIRKPEQSAASTGSDTPAEHSEANTQNAEQEIANPLPILKDQAIITENTYQDENISIRIDKNERDGCVYYVADVRLSDVDYLKTALANNTFGKNITQTTSEMAEKNHAIFAVNGDYYGFRDVGLIIRQGVLYRDKARATPDNRALVIDKDGRISLVTEGETSGDSLIQSGVLQSFSFGPVLVENGQVVAASTNVSEKANPRTAIGQIEPLHYIFVVADGRSKESSGMKLDELAQVFVDKGCTLAYNLDGGGSAAMWFNGTLINNPSDGRKSGERSISDIIYIGGE